MINFDFSYQDEFGEISPHILNEAEKIRQMTQSLAIKILHDEHLGNTLLIKAAAKVTQKEKEENFIIKNLSAYLFQIYRNLVFAELRKNNLHKDLEEDWFGYLHALSQNTLNSEEENICRKILFDEIVSMMDDWTRKVFRYRSLGYEYKDLVAQMGSAENVIRSKFSRNIREIALKLKNDEK